MKTRILLLAALLPFCGIAAAVTSGCAGTATSKSTGEFIDDAALTTKVKAELIRDPVVKAREVHVDTYKGTVQLNGFVDTAAEKMRAEQIARNVPGVGRVQNELIVKAQRTAP